MVGRSSVWASDIEDKLVTVVHEKPILKQTSVFEFQAVTAVSVAVTVPEVFNIWPRRHREDPIPLYFHMESLLKKRK